MFHLAPSPSSLQFIEKIKVYRKMIPKLKIINPMMVQGEHYFNREERVTMLFY
jgi:hypothetical protein